MHNNIEGIRGPRLRGTHLAEPTQIASWVPGKQSTYTLQHIYIHAIQLSLTNYPT